MYKNDWIMTEITKAIKFLLLVLFNKKEVDLEYIYVLESPRYKLEFERIKELLKEGRASEAEDLLFENEDSSDMVNFEIALWFYNELNTMEDKKLAEMDFTRAEIRDGLRDLLMLYGFEEYAKNIK